MNTGKPTILCVDDEEVILISLKRQLRRHFKAEFLVEVVDSGEEALEVIDDLLSRDMEVPLVISDQIMPGMKGHELLKAVRDRSPRSLTILLTGQATVEDVAQALNTAQLYRYLAKPWSETDLLLTCREATNSYFNEKLVEEQNSKLVAVNARLAALNLDLQRKASAFHRFVPRQFIEALDTGRDYDHVKRGDCVAREMTVLFADIREFTTFSEARSPNENFQFINAYLQEMQPAIHDNGGFIDKFIGDAIMALFETPTQAFEAALGMLARLEHFNLGRAEQGLQPISIGIGLNTGPLMLGIVGAETRVEGTVIGNAVNVAARLEGLTKRYQTPILVSSSTRSGLSPEHQRGIRLLDHAPLRGQTEPQPIYQAFGYLPEPLRTAVGDTRETFESGVRSCRDRDAIGAFTSFERCLSEAPDDWVAHIKRAACAAALGVDAQPHS